MHWNHLSRITLLRHTRCVSLKFCWVCFADTNTLFVWVDLVKSYQKLNKKWKSGGVRTELEQQVETTCDLLVGGGVSRLAARGRSWRPHDLPQVLHNQQRSFIQRWYEQDSRLKPSVTKDVTFCSRFLQSPSLLLVCRPVCCVVSRLFCPWFFCFV